MGKQQTEPSPKVIDLQELILEEKAGRSDWLEARRHVTTTRAGQQEIRDFLEALDQEPPALARKLSEAQVETKRGICLWLLGRNQEALAHLKEEGQSVGVLILLGELAMEQCQFKRAEVVCESALKQAGKEAELEIALAEAAAQKGDLDKARSQLKKLGKSDRTSAEALYVDGLCHDHSGEYDEAVECYQKSLKKSPENPKVVFRLAYLAALRGDEETSLEYYEKLARQLPTYSRALLNLGMLWEDRRDYDAAVQCYQRILATRPTDRRARLYLRDAVASINSVYDEELRKEVDRQLEVLSVPVTDFELSVRSRNCLTKMNIHTLGDLVTKTEQELLSYKNFGETSLAEIKAILNEKDLQLGMNPAAEAERLRMPLPGLEAEEAAPETDIGTQPISDLQLSVRAWKCLISSGIATLADLTECTSQRLLSIKNFGRTSLSEVRAKLKELGLTLKGE